jgi:FkbM family methyltransferase
MMSADNFEALIRRTANRLGIDIHRYRPEASETGRLSAMLTTHGVDLVLDVGANIGQYAQALREAGYQGRLVSFEPLSTAHAQLLGASQSDPRWEIAPQAAIGDHDGEIVINIAGNSVSSSPLNMLDGHIQAAPGSISVGQEQVRLLRLDSLAHKYLKPATVPFLKIDTQGYEDRVLDGATELLGRIAGLQLEVSFIPLYDGQQLYNALTERLRALGFSIWAIWPGFYDGRSGRMLQADVTFFRD